MDLKNIWFRTTHWETWHYIAKYIPLLPVWLWYCIRSRSLWFFTPSNPTLTFGGFEGESKREMYEQLPASYYPKSIYISPLLTFDEVQKLIATNNFDYPFAVKPDAGMMGLMFRKIENADQFKHYHQIMPVDYIVQDLITHPLEVSAFHYRFPDQQKGTITGFLRKDFLQVTGDGRSTLLELIHNYSRVRFRIDEMKAKHANRLNDIIPAAETYVLSYALNLSRGGKLVSLAHEKDENLLKIFDTISHKTSFYYGRYDIKCLSVEDLKKGKNFSILEYNGCGAEPHHIYGDGNTLLQAYKIILHHWKILYKISSHNNKTGVTYWKFNKGYQFLKNAKEHFKVLKRLDEETVL